MFRPYLQRSLPQYGFHGNVSRITICTRLFSFVFFSTHFTIIIRTKFFLLSNTCSFPWFVAIQFGRTICSVLAHLPFVWNVVSNNWIWPNKLIYFCAGIRFSKNSASIYKMDFIGFSNFWIFFRFVCIKFCAPQLCVLQNSFFLENDHKFILYHPWKSHGVLQMQKLAHNSFFSLAVLDQMGFFSCTVAKKMGMS